jgi:hypothetical protein
MPPGHEAVDVVHIAADMPSIEGTSPGSSPRRGFSPYQVSPFTKEDY